MGQVLLQWKQPAAARKTKSSSKASLVRLVSLLLMLGLLTYDSARHNYSGALSAFLVCIMVDFVNAMIPTYVIDDAGIRYKGRYRRLQYRWENIEWYSISPMKKVPDLEQVSFGVSNGRGQKVPLIFTFDPQKIDKAELLRILEERLPQKELAQLMKSNPFNDFAL